MASESGASTTQKMRVWAYQKGPGRYYRPAYRNIATAIGIEEGAVLDVGCGPGWTSIFMAAGKPHLDAVGIDTCETMLEYANANRGPSLNVTFRHMDAAEIIYPDGTFHVACAVQSAHHWTQTDEVLAEVHRVLRPGGQFFIYEADSEQTDIPKGWIDQRGFWPPDSLVKRNWQRFGMDEAAWGQLKSAVQRSPFGGGEDGRHGFYRRMVLTRD